MHLRVSLPFRLAVDEDVSTVSGEGEAGSFTLLPGHVDFASTLVPGLLWYADRRGEEVFLAIERGLLVKVGPEVRVATARAVRGERLEDVRRSLDEAIAQRDEQEQQAIRALEKMRADFVRQYIDLESHG
jgi:F-type H+-transporting ATPase subunit epsilon